jgi:hypothetical protein
MVLFLFGFELLFIFEKYFLYGFKGSEIDTIGAFEVVEGEEFWFGVVYFVVFDVIPELIVDFILEIEFDLELWVPSWSVGVVGQKIHQIKLIEFGFSFFNRIKSVVVLLVSIAPVFH